MEKYDLADLVPRWLAATQGVEVPPGLDKRESLRRAGELLALLRQRKINAADLEVDDELVNVFYALCSLLSETERQSAATVLEDASSAYQLISEVSWPVDEFGEREEMLCWCAFLAWRSAHLLGEAREAEHWLRRFEEAFQKPSPLRYRVEHFLATPVETRSEELKEKTYSEPENLLALCKFFREQAEGWGQSGRVGSVVYPCIISPSAVFSISASARPGPDLPYLHQRVLTAVPDRASSIGGGFWGGLGSANMILGSPARMKT